MRNPADLNNDQESPTNSKANNLFSHNNNGNQDFGDLQIGKRKHHEEEEEEEEEKNGFLTLSLSFGPSRPKRSNLEIQSALSPPQHEISQPLQRVETPTSQIKPGPFQLHASHPLYAAGPPRPPRVRRNPTQVPREGKDETVPAAYPWATNRRATVYSLEYLLSKTTETITGAVQCKRCEKQYELGFNLREKFLEVGTFIAENKVSMHDRAPSVWMNPVLPTCDFCDRENSVKPVISEKKKSINWLFLLLGQMLGCCSLEQLKYFCKHTKNHRTGAKDRVLYLAYLGLCKQLDPEGPFDR